MTARPSGGVTRWAWCLQRESGRGVGWGGGSRVAWGHTSPSTNHTMGAVIDENREVEKKNKKKHLVYLFMSLDVLSSSRAHVSCPWTRLLKFTLWMWVLGVSLHMSNQQQLWHYHKLMRVQVFLAVPILQIKNKTICELHLVNVDQTNHILSG